MASPADAVCDPPLTEDEFQNPSKSKDPAISTRLPLFRRLYTGFRLWLFKLTVWAALGCMRIYRGRRNAPTFTKYYDVRPNLQCRVFIPSKIKVESNAKLPTYINIHGGGFALCDPSIDDHFAYPFANTHSILVVSINYRKSPRHRFPAPINDVVALTNAVLADPLLPIDHSRVCLGGFSAGGNLTLSAALHPSLKGKLSALLPIYPVIDFSGKYKGAFRKDPRGNRDVLESSGAWFNWAYIAAGTDKKNPLLSPIYAPRNAFATQKMFFVGAEYDYLCQEAYCMAKMLSDGSASSSSSNEADGPLDVSKMESDWDKNGIKWRMFAGQQHGFTHTTKFGEEEKERKAAAEECYAEMARWLTKDVWAKGNADQRQQNGNLVDI